MPKRTFSTVYENNDGFCQIKQENKDLFFVEINMRNRVEHFNLSLEQLILLFKGLKLFDAQNDQILYNMLLELNIKKMKGGLRG